MQDSFHDAAMLDAQPHPLGRGSVLLVAEGVGDAPDEGYAKVVSELGRAIARRSAVVSYVIRTGPTARSSGLLPSRIRGGLERMRAVLDGSLRGELSRANPETVVYLSRSSITLTALLRSRLLKWRAGPARVVMIALQPRRLSWAGRLLCRWLWPDLLLVSTDEELRRMKGMGATADCMVTGVDLDRFRPAKPGEKEALRRKWRIPIDTHVVVHVGHLTGGRNLEALVPMAAEPGLTVVVVASSQRNTESAGLQDMLRACGVILIQGFRPDVDEIYRLADCYVFPTESTDYAIALPLSVLEAMASDLPVAAMRFGALPERFGGAEGVILVNTAAELVEAVGRLLLHPPSTRRYSEGYSWDALARQVVMP